MPPSSAASRTARRLGFPASTGETATTPSRSRNIGNGAVLDGGILSLSKIGRIPLRLHRPVEGTPKTVTISQEADGWYASFSCAEVPTEPLPLTGKETGIDVGLQVFLIPAEGDGMETPRPDRKAACALKKAQQRVSRRKKGSNRRKKAVKLLARKHQQVRRQRCDLHHKTALALVRHFDVISLEDLPVRNQSRRPAPIADGNGGYLQNGAARKSGLNKSIQDAGWYAFRRILAGKAAYAGQRVEAIPPAFTTQECSNSRPDGTICGEQVYKSLSVRTQVCPSCGLVLDRDENAARTIQWAGQALRGVPAMAGALNREAPSL